MSDDEDFVAVSEVAGAVVTADAADVASFEAVAVTDVVGATVVSGSVSEVYSDAVTRPL